MNDKTKITIEGLILDCRMEGEISHPIYIHRIKFNNGKFALIRDVNNQFFVSGAVLKRDAMNWYYENKKFIPLPFEYITEVESIRRLQEH